VIEVPLLHRKKRRGGRPRGFRGGSIARSKGRGIDQRRPNRRRCHLCDRQGRRGGSQELPIALEGSLIFRSILAASYSVVPFFLRRGSCRAMKLVFQQHRCAVCFCERLSPTVSEAPNRMFCDNQDSSQPPTNETNTKRLETTSLPTNQSSPQNHSLTHMKNDAMGSHNLQRKTEKR